MINLAIIGTGGMANSHAKAFAAIEGVRLVAACDIIPEKVAAFAKTYNIPHMYTEVDQLLDQKNIDAVTVVTTDDAHASVSLKAVTSGRHVLCEKPLATSYADAAEMASAAAAAGVINMVNFSYRNSSAIQKAHEIVRRGDLGRIMHVEASYLQSWLASNGWGNWRTNPSMLWRLSTQHGSWGVLGDIGVHILDFVNFGAGDIASLNCHLKTFSKADGNRIGEYLLDANDSAVINVEMVGGGLGTIHTSRWAVGQANSLRLRIYGDHGAIIVDLDKSWVSLKICRGDDIDKFKWKTLRCGTTPDIYHRFIHSIQTGQNDQPDFATGARVQKMLDACIVSDRECRPIQVF